MVLAQTCCSGGVPVSNAMGLPVEKFKGLHLNLSYDYHNLNSLMLESEVLSDNARQRTTATTLLQAGGFIGNWSVEAMLPYIQQRRRVTGFNGVNNVVSQGVGDVVLIAGRGLGSFHLSAGIKAPTGSINKSTNGIRLNADMQNGSGTWDALALGRYSFSRKATTFYAQGFHIQRTTKRNFEAGQDYRFGNETQLTVGFNHQLFIRAFLIDAGMAFRWRKVGANQINREALPGSGGDWVLWNANLRFWLVPSTTAVAVNLDLPLYAKVVGLQNVPTYRINVGIYQKISFKK